mmetsp:Transcript_25403/g.50589  ORF Transcript_25403/g.50589 Transcript_25403/m.50589 type:complete len:124 (-) Transcript_25403:372-743(-)
MQLHGREKPSRRLAPIHFHPLPSDGVGLAVDPLGDTGGLGDAEHEFLQTSSPRGPVPPGGEEGELACRVVAEVRAAGGTATTTRVPAWGCWHVGVRRASIIQARNSFSMNHLSVHFLLRSVCY